MYMQPRNSLCMHYEAHRRLLKIQGLSRAIQCLFHFSVHNIFSDRMGHLRGQ